MNLLYVMGAPASGKTTLMRGALAGPDSIRMDKPVGHMIYLDDFGMQTGLQLGVDRYPFGGTDTLSMSVQPKVTAWLQQERPPVVVAEGDRLANIKFFHAMSDAGYNVQVIALGATQDRLQAHQEARGTSQNASWAKGRKTKVERLTDVLNAEDSERLRLDVWDDAEWSEWPRKLRAHPVIRMIHGELPPR